MKATTYMNEEHLIKRAVEALVDRLGVVEANRFLSLASTGRVESVKRHRAWQKGLDKEAFFGAVFDKRQRGAGQR